MEGVPIIDKVGMINTGLIRASGFAIKIRKVAFAQLSKILDAQEIVRATAQINQVLFVILRSLGVEKKDVVRIILPYRVVEGKIQWIPEKVEIEFYKAQEVDIERIRKEISETLELPREEISKRVEEAMKGTEWESDRSLQG